MLKLLRGKQPKAACKYFVRINGSANGHYITADTIKKSGKVAEFILNGETIAYYTELLSFNTIE